MIKISLNYANGKWYAEGTVRFPNNNSTSSMVTTGWNTSHEAIQELADDVIKQCDALIADTNNWLRELEGHHSLPQIDMLWSTTKIGGLNAESNG